jgi:pimeloyl-ACP methyl ester carboxylesterase
VQKVIDGRRVIGSLSMNADGKMAVLNSTATQPSEVYALENGALRQLSHQNDAWLSNVQLATTEDVSFKAKDGNEAHGLLVKPAGYVPGHKYPALLRILSRPTPNRSGQHAFNLEREVFAANRYAVLNEPRQQWARREIPAGDLRRLGQQGSRRSVGRYGLRRRFRHRRPRPRNRWVELRRHSHRLHDRDDESLQGGHLRREARLALDVWLRPIHLSIRARLGAPWKTQDLDQAVVSIFPRGRISTPTLFMGGDKDFNVPVIGGEQMYQARSLNVPTQMVVYPNQHHGLSPSWLRPAPALCPGMTNF